MSSGGGGVGRIISGATWGGNIATGLGMRKKAARTSLGCLRAGREGRAAAFPRYRSHFLGEALMTVSLGVAARQVSRLRVFRFSYPTLHFFCDLD